MPRVSRVKTDDNRIAITEAASRLFRERGIDGVSVSELMAAAGLTHGGFYGHFVSKDALAAEACSLAFGRSAERWRRRAAAKSDRAAARAALSENYLSAQSRSSPGTSCPMAALAGDVAREAAGAPVRAAYASGVSELIEILTGLQGTGAAGSDREAAMADCATLAGALILARATAGQPMSDEFLAAARHRLASRKVPPYPGT